MTGRQIQSVRKSISIFSKRSRSMTEHGKGLNFFVTNLQRSAKRRGCLLNYSQAEPGGQSRQPMLYLLAEPCRVNCARASNQRISTLPNFNECYLRDVLRFPASHLQVYPARLPSSFFNLPPESRLHQAWVKRAPHFHSRRPKPPPTESVLATTSCVQLLNLNLPVRSLAVHNTHWCLIRN